MYDTELTYGTITAEDDVRSGEAPNIIELFTASCLQG